MKHLILNVCLLAILAACSHSEEGPKTALVKAEGERLTLTEPDKVSFLKFATVEAEKEGELRLPGRLVWNEDRTVRVLPQLGGRVLKIAVDLGASVKAGQTLAVLGSGEYGDAQADARKAMADLHVAEQAETRSKELREAGIIAEKDWQQTQADALRARAEADRAKRRLATLGGDGDGSYALKSALTGIVVERNVNPGMEFRPDQAAAPLFVVTDPSSLWLQLDAAEDDLRYLKAGERLEIAVKQFPDERFEGIIRRVADFVDPQTRTIKVRCEVPNASRRLKAEMFVHALVRIPAGNALVIPSSAAVLQGEQRYVLLEEGKNSFRRQRVELGPERDGRVEVRSGLKVGDRVVVEGNLSLLGYLPPPKDQPAQAKK